MNKQDFLCQLRKSLSVLPQTEIDEHIIFYSEIIDDRIEECLNEEEALAQIGSPEQIAKQILADSNHTNTTNKKAKRHLKAWEIVLIILGFPLWFSLLVAAFAVVLALYCCLWCVIVSLWAVFAAFVGCAFGLSLGGVVLAINSNVATGFILIGGSIVCAGLSIFLFLACKAATKGVLLLTKNVIKKFFAKKEESLQ